jgi:tetratricopeptide (TPR) repeat protein
MSPSSLALVLALALSASPPSPAARAALARGDKALAANRPQVAAAAFREALAASPGWAEAHNGLGSALFRQGERQEALAAFRAAVAADPKLAVAWFNLGFAARKGGEGASAVEAYERYVALAPEDPDGYYGLAESLRQVGQRERALATYAQYIEREKRPAEQRWVAAARAHMAALQAEQAAVRAFRPGAAEPQSVPLEEGAQPHPGLARERIGEGDRLLRERSYRAAAFAFQDAVNADPTSVEALFKLGNAYAVLGQYRQAIGRWEQARALTGDEAVKKSAADNILRAEQKSVEQGGRSPQAAGLGLGAGPVSEAARARARQSYEAGVAHVGRREFPAALRRLSESIRLEPTLAVAFVARGSAQVGLRRYTEAAADYQHALQLAPELAAPLYGLAESYRALGRLAEARQYYARYAASRGSDVRPELQEEARQKSRRLP